VCSAGIRASSFHHRPAARLGIAASAPLYVVHLDAETRRVVVGPREALNVRKIRLRDVNWIGGGARSCDWRRTRTVRKVRSTRPAQPAWLRRVGGTYEVELVDGEEGVSPGQACVFYDAPADRPACSAAVSLPRRATFGRSALRECRIA
jgi:tRNA U34 2-thiouridine synthase MnmA/TrmU